MATSRTVHPKAEFTDRYQSSEGGKRAVADRIYTSRDLCALIPAVTARKLQWFDERGIVMPHHEGHRRLYRFDEALEVAIIADLRRKGLSLQRIRAVLRLLQREAEKLTIASKGGTAYLVVYENDVILETDPWRLLRRLSASTKLCYVVDVQEMAAILNPPPTKAFRQAG